MQRTSFKEMLRPIAPGLDRVGEWCSILILRLPGWSTGKPGPGPSRSWWTVEPDIPSMSGNTTMSPAWMQPGR